MDDEFQNEASSGKSGFVVSYKSKDLVALGPNENPSGLDRLEPNRIELIVNPKLKKYKIIEDENGNIIEINIPNINKQAESIHFMFFLEIKRIHLSHFSWWKR